MGHEVVYGHHTDAEINCHHQGHDCCDHNHGEEDQIPCVVDIDPHFMSIQEFIIYPDLIQQFEFNLHFLYCFFNPYIDLIDDSDGPPDRMIPESNSIMLVCSRGLRGPPVA